MRMLTGGHQHLHRMFSQYRLDANRVGPAPLLGYSGLSRCIKQLNLSVKLSLCFDHCRAKNLRSHRGKRQHKFLKIKLRRKRAMQRLGVINVERHRYVRCITQHQRCAVFGHFVSTCIALCAREHAGHRKLYEVMAEIHYARQYDVVGCVVAPLSVVN